MDDPDMQTADAPSPNAIAVLMPGCYRRLTWMSGAGFLYARMGSRMWQT